MNTYAHSDTICIIDVRREQIINEIVCVEDNGANRMKKAERTVKAIDDNLYTIMQFVDDTILPYMADKKKRQMIGLAVEEVYINIAHYGYPDEIGDVCLSIEAGDDSITIRFSDSGIPFNPLEKTIESKPSDLRVGGHGIQLVRKIMDTVSYEYKDNKNILTMTVKGGRN